MQKENQADESKYLKSWTKPHSFLISYLFSVLMNHRGRSKWVGYFYLVVQKSFSLFFPFC